MENGDKFSLGAAWHARRRRQMEARADGVVRVARNKSKLHIIAPFDEQFRVGMKRIGGKWRFRSQVWSVDAEQLSEVRKLIAESYGPGKVPDWMWR